MAVAFVMQVSMFMHRRVQRDSMRVVNLQEVHSVHTCHVKTPVVFTNIGKAELKKVNFGQDIPLSAKYDSFHTDHIGW